MVVSITVVLGTLCVFGSACGEGAAPQNAETREAGAQAVPAAIELLPLRDWTRNPPAAAREALPCNLRLVSAAPNLTEICFALGIGEALIARTSYCDYPPAAADLPSIGALTDFSAERLLELRPDLVLVAGTSRAQVERLEALNIRYETLPDQSIADLFNAIERIAVLTGRPAVGVALRDGLQHELDQLTDRYAQSEGPTALLLIGTLASPPAPPFVAGSGSYYHDFLTKLGATNIAADLRPFAPLSLEQIVRSDPQVIIELAAGARERSGGLAEARAAWAKLGALRALEHDRVRVLRGRQHFILGPRVAGTYQALGRALRGLPVETGLQSELAPP